MVDAFHFGDVDDQGAVIVDLGQLGYQAAVLDFALPDADLVRQFWAAARCDHSESTLALAVEELIARPVYPAHLDAALIERLPESAGIYVLYDSGGTVLDATSGEVIQQVGAAKP